MKGQSRRFKMNVKATCVAMAATLWIKDKDAEHSKEAAPFLKSCYASDTQKTLSVAIRRFQLNASLRGLCERCDFGEVIPGASHWKHLTLNNLADTDLEFASNLTDEAFEVSPPNGTIPALGEMTVQLLFNPRELTKRTSYSAICVLAVLNGPAFAIDIFGASIPPSVEFSPAKLCFGSQFIQSEGLGAVVLPLTIKNVDSRESINVSFVESSAPEFDCRLPSTFLPPLTSVAAEVLFFPTECKAFKGNLLFQVNGTTSLRVPVLGKGAKLELDISAGKLMVCRERSGHSNTPTKISKTTNNEIWLGHLKDDEMSRRLVNIVNKSPVPINLHGVSVLPKSATLSQNRAIEINMIVPDALAINDRTTLKMRKRAGDAVHMPRHEGIAQVELIFAPKARPIGRFREAVSLKIALVSDPTRCRWVDAFEICGACTAVNVSLEATSLNFGSVVKDSRSVKTLAIVNRGSLAAR